MARAGASFDRPTIEVADILRRHGEAYLRDHVGHVGRTEQRVMSAITACRTAALGGHVEACDDCGATRVAYNSCRNRHCPKCQGAAREQWLAERQAELLPVPYFHVVFTLPAPIAAMAFQNKGDVYAILFKSAVEAMTTLAANPRRLGAKIGGLAILHTWGQALTHHPHVHCVAPGGGLSLDGSRWIEGRANFFLAVKPLSRLFRRLFLERLQVAFEAKGLGFFGDLARLADPAAFAALLAAMRRVDWIVYLKKPFGGPAQVLAYLGRYTHRVAIANSRIQTCDNEHVGFTWKDYRDDGAVKTMSLKPDEFIRRFLLHALPDGLHRIRHFGFLANGHRTERLALCRSLLTIQVEPTAHREEGPASPESDNRIGVDPPPCPECGGPMRFVADVPVAANGLGPRRRRFGAILHERRCDDPAHNHGSRPIHHANNRRRSKRLEPSRSRSVHQTLLAPTSSACKACFAVRRSPNPSCSPCAADPSDESALAPHTNPIASPANLPASSFNPASMRSATARTMLPRGPHRSL
jgi:hypothetical protein